MHTHTRWLPTRLWGALWLCMGRPLDNSPVAMGLCVCPPDSLGPVWVACAVRFPVAPEGFNAVLGQLARWFYPWSPL
jgi:hypothetical protein